MYMDDWKRVNKPSQHVSVTSGTVAMRRPTERGPDINECHVRE